MQKGPLGPFLLAIPGRRRGIISTQQLKNQYNLLDDAENQTTVQ